MYEIEIEDVYEGFRETFDFDKEMFGFSNY